MNEIIIGGVILRDSSIVHESARARFRDPLGAVATGTLVNIGLEINELHPGRIHLEVMRDGKIEEHEMFVGRGKLYRTEFRAPDTPCVLWYWFRVEVPGGGIVHYGTEPANNSGIGAISLNEPPAFQITVCDPEFKTPDWAKSAVMYQIFPDRFHMGDPAGVHRGLEAHHAKGRTDMWLHERWDELPAYLPAPEDLYYQPVDIFGGDIAGIRQKLPYLKELGISLIYLNPIFEAASNHRYNTSDYLTVDPILGSNADFEALAHEAADFGIRIILDGVFSHTGDDSVYFNKYGHYDSIGAYQSKDSPYYHWYRFSEWPERYATWWGFDTLPEVDEHQRGWAEFIFEGEESVFGAWLKRGASGYRLDVADELPDDVIEKMRKAMKSQDADSFLLGEVWEDATTKQSYNVPRRYALGRGLDSVMNYPFAVNTTAFLLGHIDVFAYRRFLVSQNQNYPKEMYYTLMNLLSTHDVARIRTVLGSELNGRGVDRDVQAYFQLSDRRNHRGGLLQRIAAAIQFALPGIPAVYYGDEVGMTGMLDPFNRRTFKEEDKKLAAWYRALIRIRNAYHAMGTGHAAFYSGDGNVIAILRYCLGGADAFGHLAPAQAVLTVCNPSDVSHRIVIDLRAETDCMPLDQAARMQETDWDRAIPLLAGYGGFCDKVKRTVQSPAGDDSVRNRTERTRQNPFLFMWDGSVQDDASRTGAAIQDPIRDQAGSEQALPVAGGLLDICMPPMSARVYRLALRGETDVLATGKVAPYPGCSGDVIKPDMQPAGAAGTGKMDSVDCPGGKTG